MNLQLKFLLPSLLFFSFVCVPAQVDTLFLDNETILREDAMLKADSTHRLCVSLGWHYKGLPKSKADRRYLKKVATALAKKLPEVKVLYLLNPTEPGRYETKYDSVIIDTLETQLSKLNFSKMTSLHTVYIVGNDIDYIMDFPVAFYSTPVKTVHCCCIKYGKLLAENIKNKRKDIELIEDPIEVWPIYLNLFPW